MQTKHIEKLEELNGYEWYHNGRGFYLDESISSKSKLVLIEKNYIDSDGEMEDRRSNFFSLNNLTELEFYGLKVILNEKPKLTRKERVFLELLGDNYVYIARSQDSSLSLFNDEPRQATEDWYISIHECEDDDYGLLLLCQSFPFITWESGKAWSKAELMELEVVK